MGGDGDADGTAIVSSSLCGSCCSCSAQLTAHPHLYSAWQAKKEKGAAPATPAASTEAGGKGGDDECTVDLLDIRVGQIVKVRGLLICFGVSGVLRVLPCGALLVGKWVCLLDAV